MSGIFSPMLIYARETQGIGSSSTKPLQIMLRAFAMVICDTPIYQPGAQTEFVSAEAHRAAIVADSKNGKK